MRRGGEGFKLVDQPFGVDPAQGVFADVELPGVVGDVNLAVEATIESALARILTASTKMLTRQLARG